VRDELMGKEPCDYDFCTPLKPDEIEERIRAHGKRAIKIGNRVGKMFGTIGFTIRGTLVEITSFRGETYDGESRKPDVEYGVTLEEDLSRRDFTINAIAMRGDRIIDPYNGLEDIRGKTIRAVGASPKARFKEDPLRLLRACRFAAQLEFDIEQHTSDAMVKQAHSILRVSKERWAQEMDKLLMSGCPVNGLCYMQSSGLLAFMFPELSLQHEYDQVSTYHQYPLWTHTMLVVKHSPLDINLRWAALLHDIGKPFVAVWKEKPKRKSYVKHDLLSADIVRKYAAHMKWSKERTDTVVDLVLNHMQENSPLREADLKAH